MEVDYARKGVAGAGLGLGIAGTALGLLNGGGGILNLGGWGNNCGCSESMLVNRYEAGQAARIAELETEVKLRDANTFTMGEMGKLRDYMETRLRERSCVISEKCFFHNFFVLFYLVYVGDSVPVSLQFSAQCTTHSAQ